MTAEHPDHLEALDPWIGDIVQLDHPIGATGRMCGARCDPDGANSVMVETSPGAYQDWPRERVRVIALTEDSLDPALREPRQSA